MMLLPRTSDKNRIREQSQFCSSNSAKQSRFLIVMDPSGTILEASWRVVEAQLLSTGPTKGDTCSVAKGF